MISPAQENARMLASVLGVGEDEAAEKLDRTVLVTAPASGHHAAWAGEIVSLLRLTIHVETSPTGRAVLELVVGEATRRSDLPCLFASIDASGATVDWKPVERHRGVPHPLLAAAAACPATGATLGAALGEVKLPSVPLPLVFAFDQLGISSGALATPPLFEDAVVVGAGAVAHGFLRALRHVAPRGRLAIVDPKAVGAGNLNRCFHLRPDDVGRPKAVVLAERASGDFATLDLEAHVGDFSGFVRGRPKPPATAIVTVDSRRARRTIQKEVPGRVLDASTTGISEVVVHSHRQPTEHACLACIYRHIPDEHARERSIAVGLGIDLASVGQGFITPEVAARIHEAHPGVDPAGIVGMAYDSLFKELCAADTLTNPEGRQVLAPFAFVSALAGVLLTIECLRSYNGEADTNYWKVSPWRAPIARVRDLRPRHPDCEFCSRPAYVGVVRSLWG